MTSPEEKEFQFEMNFLAVGLLYMIACAITVVDAFAGAVTAMGISIFLSVFVICAYKSTEKKTGKKDDERNK